MTDILNLQRDFSDHLYRKLNKKILRELPYSKVEALARLNIYRNNVFGNFNAVLSSIFEAVKKLVGEKYFEQLCNEYNKKHFSKSGNLDDYGDAFPQFLAKVKSKHKLTFLSDLARLELLHHKAYYSADAEKFDLKKFKKITAEKFSNLEFELHPSCFLMASEFPIFSIWKDNIAGNGKKKISLKKPELLLIERGLSKVQIHNLSPEEFIFLASSTKKKLFTIYKEILQQTKRECDIGAILNKFISLGIIANFKIGSSA